MFQEVVPESSGKRVEKGGEWLVFIVNDPEPINGRVI